jgi:uncharacterized protein YbaR (Trm112 family)
MLTKSRLTLQFDETIAEMLACPACHGDLRLETERLVCGGCGRRYPVVDGIPVLIPERAETDRDKPTG